MMSARNRLIFIVLFIIVLCGAGYWVYSTEPQAFSSVLAQLGLIKDEGESPDVSASGYIEANKVDISSEVTGRIAHLSAEEGQNVKQGDTLVELDTALLDAQIAEAQAAISVAEAQLARVKAGVPPEDIEVATVAIKLAESQRNAAYQSWQDAVKLRDNPQDLDLQIAQAQAQVEMADSRIDQTSYLKNAAELVNDLRGRQVDVIEEGIDINKKIPGYGMIHRHFDYPEGVIRQVYAGWDLASSNVWSAWTGVNTAVASRDTAQQTLNDLMAMRANPQMAKVQVAQAESNYHQQEKAVEVAQKNLDLIKAGASKEQIQVTQSVGDQAKAALATLETLRTKYTISAPIAGMIIERPVYEGEMAQPGYKLCTISDLSGVDLTVYVPEMSIGKIFLDQEARISVDAYPNQAFKGKVIWISDKAEFTPKNVQTKDQRVKMVFAIKIRVENPEMKLKPGLPADALLLGK
jgi:HlyD family secretion protein